MKQPKVEIWISVIKFQFFLFYGDITGIFPTRHNHLMDRPSDVSILHQPDELLSYLKSQFAYMTIV